MNKVYIVQEPPHERDLSSAESYGQLVTVLTTYDRPSITPGPCLYKLRSELSKFTKEDYLVWTGGDPMGALLAGIVIAELPFNEIKLLRWDRKKDLNGVRTEVGFYVPVVLNKRQIIKEFKDHEEF